MQDLFGNDVASSPAKTFEQEYAEYIRSAKWRRKAKAAMARAGENCERCGCSKLSRRLEVHHVNYDRFKNEFPEDLQVLCVACHEKADAERRARVSREKASRAHSARLDGWASKVWGDEWQSMVDPEDANDQFLTWLDKKEASETYE